jgi:hypothetical protein
MRCESWTWPSSDTQSPQEMLVATVNDLGVKATKGLAGAKRALGVDGIGTYARLQAETGREGGAAGRKRALAKAHGAGSGA